MYGHLALFIIFSGFALRIIVNPILLFARILILFPTASERTYSQFGMWYSSSYLSSFHLSGSPPPMPDLTLILTRYVVPPSLHQVFANRH